MGATGISVAGGRAGSAPPGGGLGVGAASTPSRRGRRLGPRPRTCEVSPTVGHRAGAELQAAPLAGHPWSFHDRPAAATFVEELQRWLNHARGPACRIEVQSRGNVILTPHKHQQPLEQMPLQFASQVSVRHGFQQHAVIAAGVTETVLPEDQIVRQVVELDVGQFDESLPRAQPALDDAGWGEAPSLATAARRGRAGDRGASVDATGWSWP